MIAIGTIETLLEGRSVLIAYSPLGDEVDLEPYIPKASRIYPIAPDALLDPAREAQEARKLARDESVAVLVPGRRFDASGTRHGRGGGWYDRFLSHIPASWTRIGFCFDDQFADEPLIRQLWDEPMDYVVVVPRVDGSPVLHETKART